MVILITGVSSGFGEAMARRLSVDGHKVYGTCRREVEKLPGVTYLKADVRNEDDCKSAVDALIGAEGRLDVFINNAGMGVGGPLEFSTLESAQQQMDVNWMGMVRMLHFVIPVMRRQGAGRIICFSSIGGVMGLPFQGLYCASKFAIEGYCKALRMELKNFGVDVVVVRPGDFATSFTASRKKVSDPRAYEVYSAYARSLAEIENDEQSGLKPDYLAARISRIVRCRRPKCSYVVATFVQYLSTVLNVILPERLYSSLLGMYYKL